MHTSLKNTGLQLSVYYEKGMETMGGDLNLTMATFFLTSFWQPVNCNDCRLKVTAVAQLQV